MKPNNTNRKDVDKSFHRNPVYFRTKIICCLLFIVTTLKEQYSFNNDGEFLKKYLLLARAIDPEITEEARDVIKFTRKVKEC